MTSELAVPPVSVPRIGLAGGFRPRTCWPRRPQTKGKVERPFSYVELNLLNGRTFSSLEHLNQTTAVWLANTADVRIHRETGKRPIDAHVEEQPHLLKLPGTAYDTARVVYRVVDVEGMIAYESNFYSTPWRFVGRMLPVRVTEHELIVYDPASLEPVACHPLVPRPSKGERRIDAGIAQRATRRSRKKCSASDFVSWVNRRCASWKACSALIGTARARPARC